MAPMSLEPGQIIDAKYRVVRRIGEGGMGTVYEGENKRIGRRVAIKVLHAQVAAMPEFVERFEREARAAARIGSPHVCDVLDLGDLPTGDRYIVMEYLDGVSFEDRIVERGKLTPAQLAPIAFELLEGLGTMHNARVIHRDLKPANVFLSKTSGGRGEVVKILDFGVAKLLPFGGEVGTMTQTGTMMGTPLYMSPEQARGARDVDGRTDIYAASVMFYRALTGELPYNAETLNELLFKIVLEDPRPLREIAPEVDEAFAAIIHKGLARDLEQRFETARAYQEAIAAWGRKQGRSSLSFATTVPSDPPGALPPVTAGSATSSSPRPIASAVTNGGTPIAWSEDAPAALDGPRASGSKSRAAETVMTPVSGGRAADAAAAASSAGASSAGSTSAGSTSASSAGSESATAPSGATLASRSSDPSLALGATGPSGADLGVSAAAIANATTGPTPVGALGPVTAGGPSPGRSKRGIIAGIAGAAALAVLALVAFGRSSAPPATGVTQASGASGVSPSSGELATATNATGAKEAVGTTTAAAEAGAQETPTTATTATATAATAMTATAMTATATATAATATATTATAARHDAPANVPTARRSDVPKTTSAAASGVTAPASAATAPGTTAAAPAASTAPARPASSARKFRTNID